MTALLLALASVLSVHEDAWSRVMQLAPRSDVQIVVDDSLSYRGRFLSADEQSITFAVGGHDHTVERGRVRRILLNRGTHHRMRNIAIGLAAAAVVTSLTCVGKGPGCSEASPLTFYPLAGAAVLIGAAVPSGDWAEIYKQSR